LKDFSKNAKPITDEERMEIKIQKCMEDDLLTAKEVLFLLEKRPSSLNCSRL